MLELFKIQVVDRQYMARVIDYTKQRQDMKAVIGP